MHRQTLLQLIRSRFSSRWDFYAAVFFCSWVLLLIPSWPRLPYFMDAYYHLSVMRGFLDAGGWVGHAFWEAAPVGRPHLYPPLFHFLGCGLLGLGLPVLFVARLLEFLIYPLFLFVFWRGARRLASERIAFLFLLMLSTSVPLYVYVINNAPFTLAMLFGFGAYLLHREGRWKGAGLLLAAAFYTHTLMSALTAAAFLAGGIVEDKRGLRRAAASLLLGLVLAAPLFMHQWAFRSFFVLQRVLEFYSAQMSIPLYLLAALGVSRAVRPGKGGRYFVVLYAVLAALWGTNRDRFLSGQGVIPLCYFAATALDFGWERVASKRASERWGFWLLVTGIFFVATPQIELVAFPPSMRTQTSMRMQTLMRAETSMRIRTSSALREIGGVEGVAGIKAKTLYHPRFVRELVEWIRARTRPDDILYSNFPYAGGMVAVLAHRATSTVMLAEVRPWVSFDAKRAAGWVVWFKEPDREPGMPLSDLPSSYGLVPVAETELAWIFENPAVPVGRQVTSALWGWPFILFCVFLWLFVYLLEEDRFRRKSQKLG